MSTSTAGGGSKMLSEEQLEVAFYHAAGLKEVEPLGPLAAISAHISALTLERDRYRGALEKLPHQEICDSNLRIHESTTPGLGNLMRMYVWSKHPKWLAVAHANSVAEARALLVANEPHVIGESGDGSCSIRDAARKHVLETEPTHWMGPNAEFCLSDSSELQEQEEYSQSLFDLGVKLAAALKELLPPGWGDDDTMDHLPGVKLAREALRAANGKIGVWEPHRAD